MSLILCLETATKSCAVALANDGKLVAFKESFDEKTFYCEYGINGENPIKQAYLHLKTLPEFADTVDC